MANEEVIVSRKTADTPQILELSSIGARDVLVSHGKARASQIVDLPAVLRTYARRPADIKIKC